MSIVGDKHEITQKMRVKARLAGKNIDQIYTDLDVYHSKEPSPDLIDFLSGDQFLLKVNKKFGADYGIIALTLCGKIVFQVTTTSIYHVVLLYDVLNEEDI